MTWSKAVDNRLKNKYTQRYRENVNRVEERRKISQWWSTRTCTQSSRSIDRCDVTTHNDQSIDSLPYSTSQLLPSPGKCNVTKWYSSFIRSFVPLTRKSVFANILYVEQLVTIDQLINGTKEMFVNKKNEHGSLYDRRWQDNVCWIRYSLSNVWYCIFFQMLRIRFISMGIIDDDDDDDHSMGIQRDKTRHNEMVWSLKKNGNVGRNRGKMMWCNVIAWWCFALWRHSFFSFFILLMLHRHSIVCQLDPAFQHFALIDPLCAYEEWGKMWCKNNNNDEVTDFFPDIYFISFFWNFSP